MSHKKCKKSEKIRANDFSSVFVFTTKSELRSKLGNYDENMEWSTENRLGFQNDGPTLRGLNILVSSSRKNGRVHKIPVKVRL